MTARLVTIGDSLTQGFQHGAIRRTDWAFPTMIARVLGHDRFRRPDFSGNGDGGPLLDLELVLKRLSAVAGTRIDVWDMIAVPIVLGRTMGRVEDYWEREGGTQPTQTGPIHHNLGAWGFEVLDSITLSDAVCERNTPPAHNDWIDQVPEHAMYRSARRTLNPAQLPELANLTQFGLAGRIATEEGVENLVVGLGANNVLGTCVSLQVRPSTDADLDRLAHDRKCNLWLPQHFADAYRQVALEIEKVNAQRVFVLTVPHVTIAPVTRGVSPVARAAGTAERVDGYYEFYTRFWIWDDDFDPGRNRRLTRQDARDIDASISAYNDCIQKEAKQRGWHVVDLCTVLDGLAYRRNDGHPTYALPKGLVKALKTNPSTAFRVRPDGEVLLDTRFTRIPEQDPAPNASTDDWRAAYKGGIFSLDGVHPSTIGYGIVAHEVLSAFQKANVPGADPEQLDWDAIVAHDTVLTAPPALLKTLEETLNKLFATLPLDKVIDKLAGYGAEPP